MHSVKTELKNIFSFCGIYHKYYTIINIVCDKLKLLKNFLKLEKQQELVIHEVKFSIVMKRL